METQTISPMEERKRKFFLILPLFMVPFLTIFFFVFGGGQGKVMAAQQAPGSTGFNMTLPVAHLKDAKGLNKMSFYEQADKDSALLREKMERDPYFARTMNKPVTAIGSPSSSSLENIKNNLIKAHPEFGESAGMTPVGPVPPSNGFSDPNEEKVYKKIEELNRAMNAAAPAPSRQTNYSMPVQPVGSPDIRSDVDRLERMMQGIKEGGAVDPEIQQYNAMLDKVLEIQNPNKTDSLQKLSMQNRGKTYPVLSSLNQGSDISLLQAADSSNRSAAYHDLVDSLKPVGFYGIDDGEAIKDPQNVITAAIDESQTLVTGADIKLRLTSDMYIDGTLIPAGSPLTGMASLSGERLRVEITSVRYQNAIYPVKLSVYDVDGVNGIYIPGSIGRDVSKQSADQAVGEMNLMSLDPSLGAQAANAGIQAAKTLVSKKIRLVQVTVKDGYEVFLKDNGN
jgi:conjugative transposon TraM protein